MLESPCRLLGEIRYPEDYAFERVGEIESQAGQVLEDALTGLGVLRLEVLPGPDALCFEVDCDACSPDEGAALCEALLGLVDDGPLLRLVVLREADKPISVFYCGGESIDEVTVERP